MTNLDVFTLVKFRRPTVFPFLQKRLILCIFLCFTLGSVFSQTIKGSVKDSATGEGIPFTNVFINNTTIGTTTDENGFFTLTRPDLPSTFSLVASFVGYTTVDKNVTIGVGETKTVDFILTPLESVLSEVELKSRRDKPWERNLKRFENVFLALPDDPLASEVKIINPWVLDFKKVNPEKGPNYIQATAQEPLILENEALGYKVTYFLQDYKFYKNKSSYYGLAFFEDIITLDSVKAAKYLLNKQTSYQGSVKHLMKSLLLQELPVEGFNLYKTLPEQMNRQRTNTYAVELGESIIPIQQDSIRRIPLRNGNFRIIWPDRLEVHFLGKSWRNEYYVDIYHPVGWISAPLGFFDIDRNGVPIDPTQVVLSGYIGRPRMGRTLPHDYVPPKTFENLAAEVNLEEINRNKWESKRERPYFSTNKPYYYPGERVWFGGTMLYKNQFYRDTLSQVLHVELRDERTNLVFSNQYRIESGTIAGSFDLPDSLPQGDYFIRAYTDWMRNYPEGDMFMRALPVLAKGLNVENQQIPEIDYAGDLIFDISHSVILEGHDRKALINLTVKDALDELVPAQFSLSVTNSDLVAQIADQETIISSYDWLDEPLMERFTVSPTFGIEYGITVEGKFEKTKKRDPDINPITIVRGDLEDYGVVKTDSSGYFRASGLNFVGWDTLAFAALDQKQRPYGMITYTPRTSPEFNGRFPKNQYQKYEVVEYPLAYDNFGDYILLEEFVAEDTKIESLAENYYGYGAPDREFTSSELENWPGNTIASVIGMKFGNGRLGNFNYGLNDGEPLLIIDGSRYLYNEGETANDVLQNYLTDEVKSIAVYTLNSNVFGLAGFAGVIMIETKRGEQKTKDKRRFNDFGFAKYPVKGFAEINPFPNVPNPGQNLGQNATLFWTPWVSEIEGSYDFEVFLPEGVKSITVKMEGVTGEGIPFWKIFQLEL